MPRLHTSESVAPGHPDKICDQISDAILDYYLKEFGNDARVAVEVLVTPDRVVIAGEVRPDSVPHATIEAIVRGVLKDIGYASKRFHHDKVKIDVWLHAQSPDIAQGVDAEGAGDQGLMFGYACNETPTYMPAPIHMAHRMLRRIFDAKEEGKLEGLGPDAKSQLTVRYDEGRPVGIESMILSIQHVEDLTQDDVRRMVEPLILSVLPEPSWMCSEDRIFINPTGTFIIGGPESDSGLTGRKLMVDTYGGMAPHGGGAFSGKDPTKVDRSAAYMARFIAKNIVAAGWCTRCLVHVAYAIGIADPLAFSICSYGTGVMPDDEMERRIRELVPLTPSGIKDYLGLVKPIYRPTATFGHFGREHTKDGHFTWEGLTLKSALIP